MGWPNPFEVVAWMLWGFQILMWVGLQAILRVWRIEWGVTLS